MTTDSTMTGDDIRATDPEERAMSLAQEHGHQQLGKKLLYDSALEQIRQTEQAAYERRDKDWQRWLAQTRVASAEREFDIETAIMCGGKGEPTLHDAGQVGYAAALFVWDAAITERLKAIRALAQEPEEVG